MSSLFQYRVSGSWITETGIYEMEQVDDVTARAQIIRLRVANPGNILETVNEADSYLRYLPIYRRVRLVEFRTGLVSFEGVVIDAEPDPDSEGGNEYIVQCSDRIEELKDNFPDASYGVRIRSLLAKTIVEAAEVGTSLAAEVDYPHKGFEHSLNTELLSHNLVKSPLSALSLVASLAQSDPWCSPNLVVAANPTGYVAGQDVEVELNSSDIGNLAQGFKVATTQVINGFALWLRRIGALSTSARLSVRVEQDDNGVPSGKISHRVADVPCQISDLNTIGGAFAWVWFLPTEPFTLLPGVQYWLVLEGSHIYDSSYLVGVNAIIWGVDASAPGYADGTWATYAAGVWTADATRDGLFNTLAWYDAVWRWDGAAWTNYTSQATADDNADVPLGGASMTWYFGFPAPIFGIEVIIDAGDQAATEPTFTWQYYTSGGTWANLTVNRVWQLIKPGVSRVEWQVPLDMGTLNGGGLPNGGTAPDDVTRYWIRGTTVPAAPSANVDKMSWVPGYGYDFYVTDEEEQRVIVSGVDDSGVPNKPNYARDVGQDFLKLGVRVGDTFRNVTDGSTGVITSIGSDLGYEYNMLHFSGGLSGGVENDVDNGDVFEVRRTCKKFNYFRRGSRPVGGPVTYGLTLQKGAAEANQVRPIYNYNFPRSGGSLYNRVVVKGFGFAEAVVSNPRSEDLYNFRRTKVIIDGNIVATGLVSGSDNSGVNDKLTSMTDTTKNFITSGVAAGDVIRNSTDSSYGVITGITTTTNPNDTLLFSGGLAGGTENDFDNGDLYLVWSNTQARSRAEAVLAQSRDVVLRGTCDILYWPYFQRSIVTGTDNSGVNNKTTSMVDTTRDFVRDGVKVGDVIQNTTDGSSGTITSVTTTTKRNDTLNFSGLLTGGADNDFDNGDAYSVLSVNLLRAGGAVAITIDPATYMSARVFIVTRIKYREPSGLATLSLVEGILKPTTGMLGDLGDALMGTIDDARMAMRLSYT